MNDIKSRVVEQDNKFLTIQASPKDIQILKVQWFNKPVLEIGITAIDKRGERTTFEILLVDKKKITQLLGLIGVKVSDFYKEFKSAFRYQDEDDFVEKNLQPIIDGHDDDIYFKCSYYENPETAEGNWYAFAVTTEQHVTVPHKIIEKKIKTMFKGFTVIREEFHYTPVWHVRLRAWKYKGEEFTAFVVISGGRNVKKGRIKVIPLVKIGSCDNTIRPVEYIEINHTKGWERRFDDALESAHELLTTVRETIRLSMGKDLTYDQIEAHVKDLVRKLRINETKHILIEKAVMNRINQIMKKEESLTAWDMAQAMTYVGSYPEEIGVEDVMTDYAQEQMQTLGYEAIIKKDGEVVG